jgi:hypothetical protein
MTMDYRERATYCREQATTATTDHLRADWLRIAELWLVMASDSERRNPEAVMQALNKPKKTRPKHTASVP